MQVDRGRQMRRLPAGAWALASVLLATVWFAAALPTPLRAEPGVVVNGATLNGDAKQTSFSLDMSHGVTAEIFTLASPYRVIIDLPDVGFGLSETAGKQGRGLVKAFRYGLFAENKARIVLDMSGPVRITKAEMTPGSDGHSVRLKVDLAPIDAASFGVGTGGARTAAADPQTKPSTYEDAPGPAERAKPIIVIDPGHGGIDPGALGQTNLLEKHIVLAVSREVRAVLAATGRYDVRMTRSSDVFISLDDRLKMSRKLGSDLFVSIHADSIDAKALAKSIRGATVYTLSERASDEQARLMAEKENASDILAGLETGDGERDDDVRNILIDLMKRETANFSTDFARSVVTRLAKTISMSRDPQRSAAFKVLKQTSTPSVLIELGYMSNAEDEKLMSTPAWQKQVAASIAAATDAYFAKRTVARVP